MKVANKDRDKTSFASQDGLLRFIRMPTGLKNAPGMLQRAMDIIQSLVNWHSPMVYLDDVVIFSNSPDENIDHVRQALMLLNDDE